ncbi:trypsin-like serine protease [Bdellovibrionota bacterium FG-1]
MSQINKTVCIAFFSVFAFNSPLHADIMEGTTVLPQDPIASSTVAIISKDAQGISLCSGSILAPDLVVTAGHCLNSNPKKMRVVFSQDLRKNRQNTAKLSWAQVDGGARPKDYGHLTGDEDMDDIALLHLSSGLPSGYHEAKILDDLNALKTGKVVTLAGYGQSDPRKRGAADGAGVLRKVNVKIARASFGKTEVLMDQRNGHGACHGDSGGPAFIKKGKQYFLFGVTSRGITENPKECKGASVYTNLLAHQDFLKQAAENLRAHAH